MTTPRDVRKELDAVDTDDDGTGDDGDTPPPMLISPLTEPVPEDRPEWYYHAQSDTVYQTEEVENPDEHMVMELMWSTIEGEDWYDDRFPDNHDEADK